MSAPTASVTVSRAALRGALRRLAFTPVSGAGAHRRIGVEIEMLAIDAATGRPSAIAPRDSSMTGSTGSLDWLRPLAARCEWLESATPKGTPCFRLEDGAVIGFEPGGQIEYSSTPHRSASALLERARVVIAILHAAADDAGVRLLHVGIDPTNAIQQVPLLLDQPRYTGMDSYLATRGEFGRRMMRQTAATQVAVDLGPPNLLGERWRVLNAAVPYLIAAFANSERYAGRITGHRSYRAHVWRVLDPTRTGIVVDGGDAPIDDYLDFAMRAPAIFHPAADDKYDSFAGVAARGDVNAHDWEDHLSTLFPEVRPRGYLEVRSVDAVPPEWLPAVVGIIGAISYDRRTSDAALDLLPPPTDEMLVRAGRAGLGDETIASVARDLLTLGLDGCTRLGGDFIEAGHLEEMRATVAQLLARGGHAPDAAPNAVPAADPAGARLLPLEEDHRRGDERAAGDR